MEWHKKWFGFTIPIFFVFVICSNIVAVAAGKETSEEENYLSKKKVLKVSVLDGWRPYVYKEDNTYRGITIEVLKSLQKRTGMKLEFIPAKSYNESMEQLKQGKVDIAAINIELENDKKMEGKQDISFIPYFEVPMQILTYRDNVLSGKKNLVIARVKGVRYLDVSDYSYVSVAEYDSVEQCVDSVRSKQTDFMCMDMYMSTIFMERLKSKDFVVKNVPEHNIVVGFRIAGKENQPLIPLLEKEIVSFTTAERSKLINIEGEDMRGYKRVLLFIYTHPFEIICSSISFAFVIFVCMFTYARIYVRHHKELQGYEESYRALAETFGEAGWEYDYLKDELFIFGNKRTKVELPERIEDFYEKLEQRRLPITLTAEEFEDMLSDDSQKQSKVVEFQCKAKNIGWNWYQLIYIVVCTSESHNRPIRLIGCLVNIEKEHKEKEELLELGSNERLTGLLNRAGAERLILKRLEEKTEKEEDIFLLMDVDSFKMFNDNYGHLCGDEVLRYLGERLKCIFSMENILCRWGGDEFLVYLENVDGNVDLVSKLIIQLQNDMEKFQYKGVSYPVRLSIGGIRVTKKEEWENLFKQADDVLYKVKERGKNSFILE